MHYWVTPKGYFIRSHYFLGLIIRYYLVRIQMTWLLRKRDILKGYFFMRRSLGGQ